MCGIVGAIGTPKNAATSFNLLTNLFRETQRRGPHASGFLRVTPEGEMDTDKAPVPSRKFVESDSWKQTINGGPGIIMHCRYTTHGSAQKNENNHPFVSEQGNWGLVHNGILFGYGELKHGYKLQTECDSELILRIISREKDIVRGIKKAYELLGPGGDFAVEVLHKNQRTGEVTFYFFRDTGRPGVLVDAREKLGQIFVCSEDSIWKDAVKRTGLGKELRKCETHVIAPYQIVMITASEMKIKRIVVPVPQKKSRTYTTTSRYNGAYSPASTPASNNWSNYPSGQSYQGNYSASSRGGFAGSSRSTVVRSSEVKDKSIDHKAKKSVLAEDPRWEEEFDMKTGLPTFIFDPTKGKAKIEKVDNSEAIRQCKEGLVDKSKRYTSWEDDVVSLGIMTQEKLDEFLDREALELLQEGDSDELTQQGDDEAIHNLELNIQRNHGEAD